MTFLRRPGFRAILPAAITTAVCGTLLVAPSAGATPMPMEVLSELGSGPSKADVESGFSDRFIVKFEEGVADGPGGKAHAYGRVAKELGISVRELRGTAGGAVVVEAAAAISAESADSVVALLNAHPDVEHAEEDVLLHPLADVNDTFYPQQWNLHEETAGLRVPGAWDRSTGAGETIAVLDTGITDHSDLAPNVVPGYDFVTDPAISLDGNGRDGDPADPGDACLNPEPGTEPTDSSWHGTHVAGIAAAVGDNESGVVGVAYGANLQPLRVMGACGGYLSDTIDAITWAAGGAVEGAPVNYSPARIINMSLGSEGVCSPRLQSAIDFATNQGSVVIAAAGNETQPVANVLPANCNNVIAVGATDRAGNSASYSNYGPGVDVSAPGGESPHGIGSTYNTGQTTPGDEAYAAMQGTSMAAPHVAGVAALMLAANPDLSPAQVEQVLRDSARPLPGTCAGGCGAGIVDANAAVASVAGVPFSPSIRSTADVIAADSAGTLWNYPSNGKGGLLPRVKIGSGWSSLKSGMVTDWNSDGVLDLIAQWNDGQLSHYAGKFDGGFHPAKTIGRGWSDYSVTVGQWRSSDRYPGIVASDSSGSLWFYPNSSGGGLSTRTQIGAGWRGFYLTMTDFDSDSRMDILAKKSDGTLVQYRSDGNGRFLSEPRRVVGSGWQIINAMTDLRGFAGLGQQGLMTRLTDGRLAYYPFANGRWGGRSFVGAGWGTYNIFR